MPPFDLPAPPPSRPPSGPWSGVRVIRADVLPGPRPPGVADPLRTAAIRAHLASLVGTPTLVLQELVSELVRLDVHLVPPTPERRWTTAFTTGMSARPMEIPPELSGRFPDRVELILRLPPDWLGQPLDPSASMSEGPGGRCAC